MDEQSKAPAGKEGASRGRSPLLFFVMMGIILLGIVSFLVIRPN